MLCSVDEIAATWYRGVASDHPDLQRAPPHTASESEVQVLNGGTYSAASLNLTIDNLEHVALVAITLGYDPPITVKESRSIW